MPPTRYPHKIGLPGRWSGTTKETPMTATADSGPVINTERNAERAEIAKSLLVTYALRTGNDDTEELDTTLCDLLCDLRHFADAYHAAHAADPGYLWDATTGEELFGEAVERSRDHWYAEAVEPDGFDI